MTKPLSDFIKEHESILDGHPFLALNNQQESSLVIFSGAVRRYNLLRHFYTSSDHNYLWIYEKNSGDGYYKWYQDAIYSKILENFFSLVGGSNLGSSVFIGSSMGGYAALRYGLDLGIPNFIVRSPQLTLHPCNKFFSMSRVSSFMDILELIPSSDIKRIYYESSLFEIDKHQLGLFQDLMRTRSCVQIYNVYNGDSHIDNMWTERRVANILKFFNTEFDHRLRTQSNFQ